MKILVIGGTGTVGSTVVKELMARNSDVRVLTRSEEHARALPEGVQGAVGNLSDPASLGKAFEDVDALFFVTPLDPNETTLGLNIVDAARKSEVQRIVYSSVAFPEGSMHIPHFKSKIPVEQAVASLGRDYTILRPSNFYQNDVYLKVPIVDYGIYPQPIGNKLGINRVDVRDIADAAANSLLETGHNGNVYQLLGPEVLTGDQVAEAYSRHLGKEVRYGGDDLKAWAEQVKTMLPGWMIKDFSIMFQFFQEHGFEVPDNPNAPLVQALKHEPRRFDNFAAETAKQWQGAEARK